MKNQVRIDQKALESLWNSPSNEPYWNNFYGTETKLAREKAFLANFYTLTSTRCMLYGSERKKLKLG